MDFEIFVRDPREALKTLDKLEDILESDNLANWLSGEGEPYLSSRAAARFGTEGDDAVGFWRPLALATEKIRAAGGYGAAHPINIRTTDMVKYITTSQADVDQVADGAALFFPRRGAPVEINRKIATAQAGKLKPLTPPRPVLGLAQKDSDDLTTLLSVHIQKGLL